MTLDKSLNLSDSLCLPTDKAGDNKPPLQRCWEDKLWSWSLITALCFIEMHSLCCWGWGSAEQLYKAGLRDPGQQGWPASLGPEISSIFQPDHPFLRGSHSWRLWPFGLGWELRIYILKPLHELPSPLVPTLRNTVLEGGKRNVASRGLSFLCVKHPFEFGVALYEGS